MAYSGTNSFFIRVLLDKKYALPYRVVSKWTLSCCAVLEPHGTWYILVMAYVAVDGADADFC